MNLAVICLLSLRHSFATFLDSCSSIVQLDDGVSWIPIWSQFVTNLSGSWCALTISCIQGINEDCFTWRNSSSVSFRLLCVDPLCCTYPIRFISEILHDCFISSWPPSCFSIVLSLTNVSPVATASTSGTLTGPGCQLFSVLSNMFVLLYLHVDPLEPVDNFVSCKKESQLIVTVTQLWYLSQLH